MTIKATRPGSGSGHPNTHGEGMTVEQHLAQAKEEGHMFPSDVAINRWRQQQHTAKVVEASTGYESIDAWDRGEASFPPHLRHGHYDEGY